MNKYDRQHLRNIARYEAAVRRIFSRAAGEAARLAAGATAPGDGIFSFARDLPRTAAAVDGLVRSLAGDLALTCTDGIKAEWALSNAKNDALADSVLPEHARLARYYRTNTEARDAFIARQERGMGLSERVWDIAGGCKGELELGLDCGLRDGLDAAAMARRLQQYLQHPDMLFRRVRDEHGMLQLSQRAAEFHPGRGVYRSSYKNARRLAVTETNMAYRTADHERWQQLDFIVGIEIHLSNNHTCRGRDGKPKPLYDICDELKGKYPKDFKFTGWHPHCRCIATTIIKTDEELEADDEAILRGEEPGDPGESENAVTELPDNFTRWVEENQGRIARAKSMPYFLRDNVGVMMREAESYSSSNMLTTPFVSRFNSIRDKWGKPEVDEQEVLNRLNELVSANPMLTRGEFGGFKIDRINEKDSFMQTDTAKSGSYRKDTIYISNETHSVIGLDGQPTTFNPMRELQGAFVAIQNGRELTMKQEYALESVWHELKHARAVGWRDYKKAEDEPQLKMAMETINQFCARRSYGKLLSQLGVKASHLDEIKQSGFGYSVEVGNFTRLLSHFGISEEDAFSYFKDKIITSDYEDIFGGVEKFLRGRGVKDAKKLISLLNKEEFERILINGV